MVELTPFAVTDVSISGYLGWLSNGPEGFGVVHVGGISAPEAEAPEAVSAPTFSGWLAPPSVAFAGLDISTPPSGRDWSGVFGVVSSFSANRRSACSSTVNDSNRLSPKRWSAI